MPRPDTVACVLFDFDGVIVDSEPPAARRNVRVFERMGIPATYEDGIGLCGQASGQGIVEIAARHGFDIELSAFMATREDMITHGQLSRCVYLEEDTRLMPGIRELLARLRSAGVLTALVSSTDAWSLLFGLNRFGLTPMFDAVVAGDMVERHKPDPEPYIAAMRTLDVVPGRCVVVEDSPLGIAAGVASGAYVLGFHGSEVVQDISGAHEPLAAYANFDLV